MRERQSLFCLSCVRASVDRASKKRICCNEWRRIQILSPACDASGVAHTNFNLVAKRETAGFVCFCRLEFYFRSRRRRAAMEFKKRMRLFFFDEREAERAFQFSPQMRLLVLLEIFTKGKFVCSQLAGS
jgi:hypothetical protein